MINQLQMSQVQMLRLLCEQEKKANHYDFACNALLSYYKTKKIESLVVLAKCTYSG